MKKNKLKMDIEQLQKIYFEGIKEGFLTVLEFIEYERDNGNLEGEKRKEMFLKYPPKVIYVSSSRLLCAKNGDFDKMIKGGGSAVAYAWYVWVKGHTGDTIIKWIN